MLVDKLRYNLVMTQVAVGNQIWNYQEIDSGEGTPILILHGWGRSGNEWIQMARDLSGWSGRKVYVVDLPGFGGSSLPKVRDIYEYSDLLAQFCKYLEIKRAIIIGHSLGGRVGIVLTAKSPTMVEKLILIDPAGVKPRSLKRKILKTFSIMFAWVPGGIRAKMVGRMMDSDYRNSPTLRELYRAVVKHDLRMNLAQIACTTWVIWGEKDEILPLSLTDIYKKLLLHPIIRIIWGAGHDPHLTHYLVLKRLLEEVV